MPTTTPLRQSRALLTVALLALTAAGCSKMYYKAWEKLGYEKRDLLVSRVQKARDGQNEAKEQFKTTLERFKEVTQFEGGDVEAQYNKVKSEYDRCQARATEVRDRITAVEKVAGDLFREWEGEIDQLQNADYKRQSESMLRDTQRDYEKLVGVMRKAEKKMDPVLTKFNDQVLFLKHNLNARAISSLQGTVGGIEKDVGALVKDMETSIAEADAFVQSLGQQS